MDIKAKIAKILEKAKSTDSEGEASVLLEKVNQLLEKHQLTEMDIQHSTLKIGITHGVTAQSGPTAYRSHLQTALAAYYGCVAIRSRHDNGRTWHLELVGHESARVTTSVMTDFVWKQCNAEARKLAKEHGGAAGPKQRQIVNALCARIAQIVAEREAERDAEVDHTAETANALVIRDAVQSFMDEHYGTLGYVKSGKRSTTGAARKAAAGISLNRQTGGGGAVKRIAK